MRKRSSRVSDVLVIRVASCIKFFKSQISSRFAITLPSLGGLSGSNISELKSPTKKQLPGSIVIASSIEDSSNFYSDCGTDADVGGL